MRMEVTVYDAGSFIGVVVFEDSDEIHMKKVECLSTCYSCQSPIDYTINQTVIFEKKLLHSYKEIK